MFGSENIVHENPDGNSILYFKEGTTIHGFESVYINKKVFTDKNKPQKNKNVKKSNVPKKKNITKKTQIVTESISITHYFSKNSNQDFKISKNTPVNGMIGSHHSFKAIIGQKLSCCIRNLTDNTNSSYFFSVLVAAGISGSSFFTRPPPFYTFC